jgi:multiple sugar transport system permease protein
MKQRTIEVAPADKGAPPLKQGLEWQGHAGEVTGRRALLVDSAVKAFLIALVTALALIYLLPMYWLFITSIKFPTSLYEPVPELIPDRLSLLSWQRIISHPLMGRWFLNSGIVAIGATAGTIAVASIAGYVFAKMEFPGKRPLFWLVLLTLMLPGQATIVPMYALMLRLGWVDTFWPLIIPAFGDAFAIFLMKQFMQTLPSSLIDAARIDGTSEWKIFWRIVLPLAKPGLAVLTIFTFVSHWNSFLWPLLMLRQNEMYTLQVGLASMRSSMGNMQLLMAAAAFTAIPMVVVFALFQRYFLEGLTIGAMKG